MPAATLAPSPAARLTFELRVRARRSPLTLIGAGVVLYSIGPVLLQASSLSGPAFSFWRLWLGVPVLALASARQLRRGGLPDARGLRWAALAGLAFAGHQLLFMTAVKATSVADVALMNTLAPLVTGVGAAWLFDEHPGARFRAWTLLAIAGAAVIVLGGATGPRGSAPGMAMAIGNVVMFAAFFLVSKRSRDDIPVLPFLLGVMVVASLAVTVVLLVTGIPVGAPTGRDLALCFAVAAGPGALGHFVMTWPLRWVPANVPPVMRLGQPVLAGVLAWALLSEPITMLHIIGGGLTMVGVCGALVSPSGRRFAASTVAPPAPPAPPT